MMSIACSGPVLLWFSWPCALEPIPMRPHGTLALRPGPYLLGWRRSASFSKDTHAQIDPLADLKAEIAAEADPALARRRGKPRRPSSPRPRRSRQVAEAEANEAEPEPEKKGKKPPEERMVPVERMNEYAVQGPPARKREGGAGEEAQSAARPPPPAPKTEDQIRAEARALARLEIQLEAFSEEGNARYTQKAFDAACDKIAKLIAGPSDLVALAIEATGSPKDAAVAIMALGSGDAPEIEGLPRSSARSGRRPTSPSWATARTKKPAEEEPEPPRRKQVEDTRRRRLSRSARSAASTGQRKPRRRRAGRCCGSSVSRSRS